LGGYGSGGWFSCSLLREDMDMLDEKLLMELQEYVEKHLERLGYVLYEPVRYDSIDTLDTELDVRHDYIGLPDTELENFIKDNRKPTFHQILFSFIDKKGASDSDVYKSAGVDRRHFSKIRSNPDYRPGKNTVIALALALELNKKETDRLLSAAGYSLSESNTFDLIIMFFLEKKIYDLYSVNQALDYFSQKPLAGVLE
jgi:hypothetical protein